MHAAVKLCAPTAARASAIACYRKITGCTCDPNSGGALRGGVMYLMRIASIAAFDASVA